MQTPNWAELFRDLDETARNLRARGIKPAADVIGRAVYAIRQADAARDDAVRETAVIPQLKGDIERLRNTIADLHQQVARAQEETRQAGIPLAEAQARARKEVRDLLRPFLTEGDAGQRMLALTFRHALDKAWGKEEQPMLMPARRAMRFQKETS